MYRGSDGRFVLAGTISRGYGCGLKLYPGVHTNLRSRAHLAWIKKTAFKQLACFSEGLYNASLHHYFPKTGL